MLDFLKIHKWAILVILLFFILSYFIIGSDYNHVFGDAGCFAQHAKIFYETHKIDTKGAAPVLIGQILFSNIFLHIFGFSLKMLHISVYFANFLLILGMYLLLYQLGIDRFLAVIGALVLIINPIYIKMIDWFMSEPFFMFYLVLSLLFLIKGLKFEKYGYLYIGGIFGVFAILTRQHAISLSIGAILLCIVYRKRFKKKVLYHFLISSVLPIIAVGLYYLIIFIQKKIQSGITYAYAPENIAMIKALLNPINLFSRLYIDSLYFLHYVALYTAPLFIVLFLSFILRPKRIMKMSSRPYISVISILFISLGTVYLYTQKGLLMPYVASIFSIGTLTGIFGFSILSKANAGLLLTAFTTIGAIIVLMCMLEYFSPRSYSNAPALDKKDKHVKTKKRLKKKSGHIKAENRNKNAPQVDLSEKFLYFWAIAYILVTILVGLRYDRYIFPLTVLIIFMILNHFPWLKEQKAPLVIILILVYSVFIYNIAIMRLSLDTEWDAAYHLMDQGISPGKLNVCLGFNNFYSFDYINDLYKDLKSNNRFLNWHLFHPLADYFFRGEPGLDRTKPGIEKYEVVSRQRWFGILKVKIYVYKRKEGFIKPIYL